MQIQFNLSSEAEDALKIAFQVGVSKGLLDDVKTKPKQVDFALRLLAKIVEKDILNINDLKKF